MLKVPRDVFGRVEKIAKLMVDRQEIKKIMVGKIILGSSSNRVTSTVIVIDIMIALTDIKMFDLLSAMELKLIWLLAVSLNMDSTPREYLFVFSFFSSVLSSFFSFFCSSIIISFCNNSKKFLFQVAIPT
jgi:hypothetical protein